MEQTSNIYTEKSGSAYVVAEDSHIRRLYREFDLDSHERSCSQHGVWVGWTKSRPGMALRDRNARSCVCVCVYVCVYIPRGVLATLSY